MPIRSFDLTEYFGSFIDTSEAVREGVVASAAIANIRLRSSGCGLLRAQRQRVDSVPARRTAKTPPTFLPAYGRVPLALSAIAR
jgi:hypothetical protein